MANASSALLIQNARVVLPLAVQSGCDVLIEGDRITAIGANLAPPPEARVIDGTHCLALPGLINAHTHLEQTFMRGYAASRSLLDWLKNYIWKLQAAMDAEDVRLAATLGLVEAMRGGAATIVDHHKVPFSAAHTDVVLQAAERLGVRLVLARGWADQGANAEAGGEILGDLERLFAQWDGAANGRIRIANGPLAPWRCSDGLLRRTTELARAHGAITHCHMNETQDEVALTLRQHGVRPVEWYAQLGLLGPDFHAVHGVWLSDNEIKLLAASRARVTHCPAANMILASGAAPIGKLRRMGVPLALASDGPASNDGQDMVEMMRLAAYLARVSTMDPQAAPPREMLNMATLPLDTSASEPAGLAVGAKADLTLMNLNTVHAQPVADPLATLVYSLRGSDVKYLIVDGRLLIDNTRCVDIDELALLDECRARAAHLARRAGVEL